MSNEGETKDLEVVRTTIEMANDLIYRKSDDKEIDYWQAIQFLDQLKDKNPDLLERAPELYGEMLETMAVGLVRGMNFLQADAVLDHYKDTFPDDQLPDRLQEVSHITSAKFRSLDEATPI